MKIFSLVLAATLVFCGCERHSAEETAAFHEKHGHHEEGEHQKSGATETKMHGEHAPEPGKKADPHAGH